ncbi:hypothetical protein [Burkholderia metallica]|uniref:hypothetical protein n=1 Tax=Burkholderia metallica TaxID=488729 RepID=UPI001589674A|nr:hypothetical protein [Burkholderia metallica]
MAGQHSTRVFLHGLSIGSAALLMENSTLLSRVIRIDIDSLGAQFIAPVARA